MSFATLPHKGTAFHEVRRRLERSRSRYMRRLLLRGLFRSLQAALAAVLLAELLRFVLHALAVPYAFGPLTSLGAGLGVLLAGCLVTLWHAGRCGPTLLEVARRADIRFGLEERASAGLEASYGGTRTPVDEALIYDAARHASVIEPRKLVPMTLPGSLWSLAVMSVFIVGLQFVPSLSLEATPTNTADRTAFWESSDARARTGESVRRVADIVRRSADENRDSYMRAVAGSLDDLGRKIERGELDRAAAEQELGRLLEHLGRALGPENAQASALLAQFSSSPIGTFMGESLAPDSEAAASSRDGSDRPAGPGQTPGTSGQAASRSMEGSSAGSGEQGATNALDELLRSLGADLRPQDEGLAGSETQIRPRFTGDARSGEQASFYADVIGQEDWEGYRPAAREGLAARAAGIPTAAQDAGRGEGDLAGEGTQPLMGREGTDLATSDVALESVVLPNSQRDDGRRIKIELPPTARFTAVSDAAGNEAGGWRRLEEAPMMRYSLGAMYRDVVSEYFLSVHQVDDSNSDDAGSGP